MSENSITPDTKDNSLSPSALNATRHGCCALAILILSNESRADFDALEAGWRKTYAPKTEAEHNLLNDLIQADWLQKRSARKVAEMENLVFDSDTARTEAHLKLLDRFHRYRTANQNAFNKCRKALEEHLKNRAAEVTRAERTEFAKKRLEVFERKNKPAPTYEENLQDMREEAIRLGYTPLLPASTPKAR